VFLKDRAYLTHYPNRIATSSEARRHSVTNCILAGEASPINLREFPEDQEKLRAISLALAGKIRLS